jgi:hypothetical protein
MDCLIDFSAGFSAALSLIHFPIRKIYSAIMVAVSRCTVNLAEYDATRSPATAAARAGDRWGGNNG